MPNVSDPEKSSERTKRVLVADDDAAVAALLRTVLSEIADVTVVGDAESALALLAAESPYDAIISDFMLPGIDGVEFVQRIRNDEQSTRVPILMISGHGAGHVSARAREAGADEFLDKPFRLEDLRAVVAGMLRVPRVRFA